MATLSKNGTEVARIQLPHVMFSIRSNGKVLANHGYGWKVHRQVRDPQHYADHVKMKINALSPQAGEFRNKIVAMFPNIKLRAKVYHMIEMMPNDPDGIWASLGDEDIHESIEEIVALCHMYQAIPN